MEAVRVFDSLNNKPLTSWGALIDGYASLGTHTDLALEFFGRMRVECVKPNIILYSSALKACLNVGTLEQCHALHTDIICNGLEIDAVA
jgi:pentatricopeptide repeat protein